MFYKLSNTAPIKVIEEEFNAKFEYATLYKPTSIINGLEESNLSIITMQQPSQVKIGIWGILPQDLEENWKIYQNFTNTLNINLEEFDYENSLYSEALDNRRCIVVTNGFFTSVLINGKMYPYQVYLKDHKPFGIAGIFNKLEDGFITCSILINRTPNALKNVPNMLSYKPVIFDKEDQAMWFSKSLKYEGLRDLVFSHKSLVYFSQEISKEFYDNDIIFYKDLKNSNFADLLKIS